MTTIRPQRGQNQQVTVGPADPAVTGVAGIEAVRQLNRVLGLAGTLDAAIGPIKQRDRGLTGGQFLVSLASAQLTGGKHLVSLDRRRTDQAGQLLEAAPTPASTTARKLAQRFGPARIGAIETAVGQVNAAVLRHADPIRRSALLTEVTIDGDATDIEVYGPTKDGAVHNYKGERAYRGHIGYWAELGVPVAADLLGGNDDPRSYVRKLLRRAVSNLPAGVEKIRSRWDGGYFARGLAEECIDLDVGFAIGAKRSKPMISAANAVPEQAWVSAVGMEHTEIAVIGYLPGAWPAVNKAGDPVVCIARRTRIPVEHISADPRSRKRRTIPKDQLALALDGKIDAVYGYSFFLTDQLTGRDVDQLITPDPGAGPDITSCEALAMLEWWYRHRTDIEALNRDAKHGADLFHLPSADRVINTVWMWGALLACAMSAWLQEVTRIDAGNGRGRRVIATLRHELICVPARVISHAGRLILRPAPGARHRLLTAVLARLRALPSPV